MGRLTTHVLDTVAGRPAAGIRICLYLVGGATGKTTDLLRTAVTNADGRCDAPLLEGDDFRSGVYELLFDVGAYYAQRFPVLPDPPFLGEVVIRFGVAAPHEDYHVPLVMSPWSYSTYRGS